MTVEFRKILPNEVVNPKEKRELRSVSMPFAPAAETVDDNFTSCRPFVNDLLNSRLAQTLPAGEWTISSSASLESGLQPKHILHTSDRIIIQGDGPWELFDNECQSLARGYVYGSDVVVDIKNNLFYLADSTGMIEAHNLSNGSRFFSLSLLFGQAFKRSFITRRDKKMIVVSTEQEMDMHSPEIPEDSTIEVIEFGEPENIDADGILNSVVGGTELQRKTLLLLSAFRDDTLTVATDNQICLLDLDLQIKSALNGSFTPVAMSLNNAGVIYLITFEDGITKLNAIKMDGEVIFSTELPAEMSEIAYPPIITYDQRIFLVMSNYLMAFDSQGKYLWEYKTSTFIAGATVTAENQLLTSIGEEIGVFEVDGRYRRLFNFKNETLQTPPTLNSRQELLVATNKKLYCLAAQL